MELIYVYTLRFQNESFAKLESTKDVEAARDARSRSYNILQDNFHPVELLFNVGEFIRDVGKFAVLNFNQRKFSFSRSALFGVYFSMQNF